MLTYKIIGPTDCGNYAVVYQTPGCQVSTIAIICRTESQAIGEAERLNAIQVQRECAMQLELALRGIGKEAF